MKTAVIVKKESREIALLAHVEYDHDLLDPAFLPPDDCFRIILTPEEYSRLNAESLAALVQYINIE